MNELRHAVRSLFRNPAFSLAAICVLGVGLGASAVVFSVVDRLLFRSLPYPQDDRLVSVGIRHPIIDGGEFLIANTYLHLREQDTPFTALASWTGVADCDLTEEANAARLACAQIDSSFLPAFGITPLAGRNFTNVEDAPAAHKVALMSYGLWHGRFGGERSILGRTIPIDGVPVEIIGILPSDFELPALQKADLVVPQALNIRRYTPGESGRPLRVFARLKDGVSIEQVRAQLAPATEEMFRFIPDSMRKQASFVVRPVRELQIQDVKLASWILFATTLAILLIVCANVANLMLARSEAKRREFTMRLALGAGRWHLMRQAFAESLLVSGCGAVLGATLAWVLAGAFRVFAPAGVPRIDQIAVDWRVLAFLFAAGAASGIVTGLVPAFMGVRIETLAGWRGVAGSHSGALLRRVLITAQIALSLTLLSDAALLLESLRRMTSVDGGLEAARSVTAAEMTLGTTSHPNAATRQQFFDALAGRLRANPLVTSVALSDTAPPSGFIHTKPPHALNLVGRPGSEPKTGGAIISWRRISPGYFETLGIPILRGRTFTEAERALRSDSIIVSTTLAKALVGSLDVVGETIHFKPAGPDATVIGVVADADNAGIPGHSDPEYYLLRKIVTDSNAGANEAMVVRSLHQYDGQAVVLVRSVAAPSAVAGWIRSEVAGMDPACAVTIETISDRIHAVSARPRFNALLLSLFALIGLVVSAAGLYGLIAYLAAQRTQEIGVRLALGATPTGIASLIVGGALRSTAAGIAIGLAGSFATGRLLEGVLFGMGTGTRTGLLFAATLTLVAVAILAAFNPARRAGRTDPMVALRHE